MPRRRQSLKAQRQTKKRHYRNLNTKHEVKKIIKEFLAAITEKNADGAKTALKKAASKLAKAAKKGIVHKNTAQRKISRLSKKLAKLGA